VAKVCLVIPRGTVLDDDMREVAGRADAGAASVTDIVTALAPGGEATAGTGQGDEAAVAPASGPALPLTAPPPAAGNDVPGDSQAIAALSPVAGAAAVPTAPATAQSAAPATVPAWMRLLYGEAARYGTADGACRAELETQYPRLMLRMVEGWRQPSFAAELNQLILDDRGDRQGFAPEVMEELWFLCQTHALVHAAVGADATAPPAAVHEYPASAMLVDESLAVSARKDAWMAALEGV
jgi:hypothetical protein